MPFKEVPPKVDFPAQEMETLRFWKETHAFQKMVDLHKGQPRWSFIDGPITANNPMAVHHGWGRTYKDLMLRFQSMRGQELRYQNGFDCQGLWVEVNVERDLGFKTKKDIEAYGLAKFVLKCKERVLNYAAVQTEQSIRLGYWMDWNEPDFLRELGAKLIADPSQVISVDGPDGLVTGSVEQIVGRLGMPELGGSYFTFSNENNYMIWTFLKKCWEKDWIYRGADVMPWCPRCATALSQHEIVTDGYKELTHDSVTVRFPLRNRPGESLLIWTTTPWTLSSNVAAAVGKNLTYVRVKNGEHILYLSKGTLHMLRGEKQIQGELKGEEMVGWTYDGPFDDLEAEQKPGGFTTLVELIKGIPQSARQAHQVILWDEVGEEEGTGIVHIAPGCGAEDFGLGKQYHLPVVAPLDEEGYFVGGFGFLSGLHVSEVSAPIFNNLEEKGILYHVEPYTHRYPVCWRCDTELVFRLVAEWFISMGQVYDKPRHELSAAEKAASLRYQIMDVVEQIHWIPEFGLAREMDWLHNMHDWMISKKRYWGLALPIWECESCQYYEVIGDEKELQSRAISGWESFAGHTPHRPFIDAIKLTCKECGGSMSRIRDVGNPWLDAGIVSFSTLQYRTNPDYWKQWYPADWISESFPGQFRNWFYSLLVMSTVLSGKPSFMQNFGYATVLGADGRPMHKSWGNAIEFDEAADKMGVDVMRWLYCTHRPENDLMFGFTRGDEVRRQFLIPLWNAYSFLATYARLDNWSPVLPEDAPGSDNQAAFDASYPEGPTPHSENLLDRWILARLNQVTDAITRKMEASDFYTATQVIEAFLDDLTNWHIRRSRRRFWKSEHDTDKNTAYATLYHVMVKLARLLAPFTPFVTETMYQNLVRSIRPQAYESIHHTGWPVADLGVVDQKLIDGMALARRIASLGLGARAGANLKVRQPLGKALVHASGELGIESRLAEIVVDELNVKSLEFVEQESTLVTYKILPDNKLLGPRLGALFPRVRSALAEADPAQITAQVRAGNPVMFNIDGESIEVAASELIIQTQAVPGLVVASDHGITVAIDTTLTPELRAEGLAREIVRRIQDMRKNAGFNIEDRITTYYQAGQELAGVMQDWESYLKAETLTTALHNAPPPEQAYIETHSIDGTPIALGVERKK